MSIILDTFRTFFSNDEKGVDSFFKDEKGKIFKGNISLQSDIKEVDESGFITPDDGFYKIDGKTLRLDKGKIVKIMDKNISLSEDGVSSYIELPVGVHTIGDSIYTVVEKVDNEGQEDEYRYNIITSIIPKDNKENDNVDETNLQDDKNKNKNMSKKVKFSRKPRFKARLEGAEVVDEMTVVAEEIKVDEEIIVITEELEIVEDFSGELTVEVEGTEEVITVVDGVITEVEEEEDNSGSEDAALSADVVSKLDTILSKMTKLEEKTTKLESDVNKFSKNPSANSVKLSQNSNNGKIPGYFWGNSK